MAKSITAVLHTMDPDLPLDQVKTMDQLVHESLASDRFSTVLFASFAGLALLLAAIGIYGVISYAVFCLKKKIRLHIALVPGPQQVVRLSLEEGMLLDVTGLAV